MSERSRVICLLDFNWRSFWIVLREISGLYEDVIVVSWNNIDLTSWGVKSYCIGQRSQTVAIMKGKIEGILSNYEEIDLFPITDFALMLSYELDRAKYKGFHGPSREDYMKVSSKANASQVALTSGFKVAKPCTLENEELSVSCFLRPEFSVVRTGNSLTKTKNYLVKSAKDLPRALKDIPSETGYLLQKTISGKGVGINVYARHGKVELLFATIRLTEPINGGASSKRGRLKIDESVKRKVRLFVRDLNYTGIMMIELMLIKDKYYFIECNTRPWGSISVAHANGFYFCSSLILGKPIFTVNNSEIALRHLGKDYYIFREKVKRSRYKSISHLIGLAGDLVSSRVNFDEFKFGYWKLEFQIFLRENLKYRSLNILTNTRNSWKRLPTIREVDLKNKKVLYVCKGNINRSAIAEILSNENISSTQFSSCGLVERVGRPISFDMSVTLIKSGITNFYAHRSSNINEYDLRYFDYIVVFDREILKGILNIGWRDNLVRFHEEEVKDPYSRELKFFEYTLGSIKSTIDAI